VERDALLPQWGTDGLARRGMPSASIDTWDMDRRKLMRMARESDRELMRDYYVDGYSGPELSERYGQNRNTIKIRIMRASDRLAAQVCGKRR
jgi:DNA-directed RNA polymerase specialized sigma24 family protein